MMNRPINRGDVAFAIMVIIVMAATTYVAGLAPNALIALVMFTVALFMVRQLAFRAGETTSNREQVGNFVLLFLSLAVCFLMIHYIFENDPLPLPFMKGV